MPRNLESRRLTSPGWRRSAPPCLPPPGPRSGAARMPFSACGSSSSLLSQLRPVVGPGRPAVCPQQRPACPAATGFRPCWDDLPRLPPPARQNAWGCRGGRKPRTDVHTRPHTARRPSLGCSKDASFSRHMSLLLASGPRSCLQSFSVKSVTGPSQGAQGQTTKDAGHSTWVLAG